METALRENRIEYYATKIAACKQEYVDLDRKSSAPDLTIQNRTAISRIKEETIERCVDLQYLLGLYEHQGQCEAA